MDLTFKTILQDLTPDSVFRIANELPPPSNYLWAGVLPEMRKMDYTARTGHMTIRSTMAGVVGLDSPYPEVGVSEIAKFSEDTYKFASRVSIPESSLREIQQMVRQLGINLPATNEQLLQEVFNFTDKLLVQSHIDLFEWLRGQALTKGAIDWTFNKMNVKVDYGVPSGNKLTKRTGNNAYGGTTSKFWTDVAAAQKTLRRKVSAFYMNTNTYTAIVSNDVNAVVEVGGSYDTGQITLQRKAGGSATAETLERGSTYRLNVRLHDGEGEILDPDNPGKTIIKQFLEDGYMVAVGTNERYGYTPGLGIGSTTDPRDRIGYTHLAPTTEGNMQPGRWARIFTPEGRPWALQGECVTNGLPVIEYPEKIVIAQTEVS